MIISEIIFASNSNTLSTGKELNNNYSIELYNPTSTTVDLSSYAINLTFLFENPESILLRGNILPEETYVISFSQSNDVIQSRTDQISDRLDFRKIIRIELSGQNGELIDSFGSKDITDLTEFDLSSIYELIDEPVNINLNILQGFNFRRNHSITEGNRWVFNSAELIKNWQISRGNDFDDLGVHYTICNNVTIGWETVVQILPEERINESVLAPTSMDVFQFVSQKVTLSQAVPVDVSFSLLHAEHEFLDPALPAIYDPFEIAPVSDYATGAGIYTTMVHVIPANTTFLQFDGMVHALEDGSPEVDEGFGIKVFLVNGGGMVIPDSDRDLLDIIIEEFDTNTSVGDKNQDDIFNIYPSLATNEINVELQILNSKIENVKIFNVSGLELYSELNVNQTNLSVDVSNLEKNSVYFLRAQTDTGKLFTQKFIK